MNSRTRIPGLDEYAFSSFDRVASRQWDYIVIGAGCNITGAATFPNRGAWNPTLTMTALCLRLARRLTRPDLNGPVNS